MFGNVGGKEQPTIMVGSGTGTETIGFYQRTSRRTVRSAWLYPVRQRSVTGWCSPKVGAA